MPGAMSGNPGEAAVLAAFIKKGWHVLVPFGGGHPYDLAVDVNGKALLRVQCKTAWARAGCISFNTHATDHGRGPLSYVGRADIFGVYSPVTDAVYLVPVPDVGSSEGRLRLEPTRNNQRRRVRMAADYEIARWSEADLCSLPGTSLRLTLTEPTEASVAF
jgi:hypothetical protein